jgi:hypothetical protein
VGRLLWNARTVVVQRVAPTTRSSVRHAAKRFANTAKMNTRVPGDRSDQPALTPCASGNRILPNGLAVLPLRPPRPRCLARNLGSALRAEFASSSQAALLAVFAADLLKVFPDGTRHLSLRHEAESSWTMVPRLITFGHHPIALKLRIVPLMLGGVCCRAVAGGRVDDSSLPRIHRASRPTRLGGNFAESVPLAQFAAAGTPEKENGLHLPPPRAGCSPRHPIQSGASREFKHSHEMGTRPT